MSDFPLMTAEEFADEKYDLAEGGRWHELVGGKLVNLHPPDAAHGTALINFSKVLAQHLQRISGAYACFELGLVVTRNPDTVRCPPLSLFADGALFAESDKIVTDSNPVMIFEIASTADRRQNMEMRIHEYLDWGVELVWVANTVEKALRTIERNQAPQTFLESHEIDGGAFLDNSPAHRQLLAGFRLNVADVFVEPDFWRK